MRRIHAGELSSKIAPGDGGSGGGDGEDAKEVEDGGRGRVGLF